jgi:hypothetical protein
MSQHQFFRRSAVPQQVAQQIQTITLPAPTRGIIQNENESYTQPGAAIICDNWKPTMKGVSLRGGCARWAVLPETTPIISGFEYASGINLRMFFCNATKIYDTTSATPVLVKSGQTSGNHVASQMANQAGDWLLVVNDAGDPVLRFDGTSWETLISGYVPPGGKPSTITGPVGTPVANGGALVYVCKYRNRYFFIERNSMNAWYLPLNAVGGLLALIPLSGAATKGGKLLFCATWSIDAGDGIDDKLVFITDLGEALVFTGSDPSVAANWRQEGRYNLSPPMGMNAHIAVGGDLLVATVDGILPISGAITKDRAELELAAVTRTIKPMWRAEVNDKRALPWTMCKWDEYGAIFTTFPGGDPGKRYCLVTNAATGAHARFVGWDVMCFARLRGDMYFGTQNGIVMLADRTGYDDGLTYTAVLVGGWEMFQSASQTVTWRQARAAFQARPGEPFIPQLSATTDYVVTLPTPPPAGADPGPLDLWDDGFWDDALWDAEASPTPVIRNTGWVSIGVTGFSHAPIVQVTVGQVARPEVDLISIAATYERDAITV